jgi:hypothetical protein
MAEKQVPDLIDLESEFSGPGPGILDVDMNDQP